MRLKAIALFVALFALTARAAEDAKPLTPEEAAKQVDKDVTVQFEVKSATVAKSGVGYLNSAADFKDKKNFAVFIDKATMAKFKDAKIEDPATHFKGKLVEVKGKVTLFKDAPQIKLSGPDAIKIVEKK
jgi:DNA/RNA endonuclease YhcR with UshA esterase domain